LENYNGYLKTQLGKNRTINWVNFLNFLKLESDRTINKLLDNSNIFKCDINKAVKTNEVNNEYIFKKADIINEINEDIKYLSLEEKNNNNNFIENKKEIIINSQHVNVKDININDILNSTTGISNIGNSCFANAILQIIIHLPIFLEEFLNEFIFEEMKDNSITMQFFNFIKDIFINKNNKYIDIARFLYIFGLKHLTYSGYVQHDALEFLRYFLDDISIEMNVNKEIPLYKEIIFSDETSKFICKKEFDSISFKRENSIITRLFYSQLLSSFKCSCKHVFYSLQNISDITLILPRNNGFCHVKDLIKNYFNEEIP